MKKLCQLTGGVKKGGVKQSGVKHELDVLCQQNNLQFV